MGIEIPSEVTWLFPIVVGQSWPEGDETALRRMADAYRTAAQGVKSVIDEGNGAASTVFASQTGEAVQRFEEYWKKFADGDDSYLPKLQKICEQLAESCDNTALEVEYTKLSIIASLIALAIEIAALIAAAFGTFGATTAGIPIAQQATRLIVQFTFRQLIIAILKEVAISVGIDAAIQAVQVARGDRQSWDWGKTTEAAVSGVVSGAVGGLSGGLKFQGGGLPGQVVVGATRGAVEGAVSTVGTAAVLGQDISARDVLMGASAGAVSGGIGGAKDGISVDPPRINPGGPDGPPNLGPAPGPAPGPAAGGPVPGGAAPGGAMPGGPVPGGATPGGVAPGGSAPGGPAVSRDGLDRPLGGSGTTTSSAVAAPPAPGRPVSAPPSVGGDSSPASAPAPSSLSAAPGGVAGGRGGAAVPTLPGGGTSGPSIGSRLGTAGGSAPVGLPGGLVPGGAPGGSTPGGTAPGGTAAGSTPGGTAGRMPGGMPAGGPVPGGSAFAPGSVGASPVGTGAAPGVGSGSASGAAPGSTPGSAPGATSGVRPGVAMPGGVAVGGAPVGGAVPGGSPFGGSTPGGPVPGGPASGGVTPGGPPLGGPVPGSSTPGGVTPGGPPLGGATPGGPVPGATPGGALPGATPGGPVPGGPVPGGPVPGGVPAGGSVPGGPVPGGAVPTGSAPNGSAPAGSGTGSGTHVPAGPSAGTPATGPAGTPMGAPMGAPMAGAAGGAPGGGSGGRGGGVPLASGFAADPGTASSGPDLGVRGDDAVNASSLTGMPVHSLPDAGPVSMPEQRGPASTAPPTTPTPQPGGFGPQPGGFGPQPGGFGPQPGGFGPQPGGPAAPGRPEASAPARTPETAARPTPPSTAPSTAPIRVDGPAPAARGGTDGPAPSSNNPSPTPDTTSSPDTTSPLDTTPPADGPAPDSTPPDTADGPTDLVGEPGDQHTPASSHEWPAEAPGETGTGTGSAADPFPQKNVWNQPAGVVPGFSHNGDYFAVHESTGPTDQSVGTYDQRAAALVEPTYQPYGPHGDYQSFRDAHSKPDGSIDWPPNQGADGARVVVELPAGTVLDRFGSPNGDFLSPLRPDGQAYGFGERAIMPDSLGKGYHVYVLDAPLTVELAQVAPAFDQNGGARQLQPVLDAALADPATGKMSVQRLLDLGVLHEVDVPPADGRVLPPDFGTFDADGTVLRPDVATVADAQAGAFSDHPGATPTPDLGPVSPNGPIPLGEVSQRVDQAIRNSQVTDSGVALHTEDRLRDLSGRIPATDGQVVLDVHTDGDGVRVGDTRYTRDELVQLINNHPDLAGRPITLVGCDAGAGGDNSLAAHVARETGQRVFAPDTLAWSDRHGNVYASSPNEAGTGPKLPPDGGWHAFEPDGTHAPVGEHGMPPGHEPKGDLAVDDQAHRGRLDIEPQVQQPWSAPETTHEQHVRLRDDQSFFQGQELPRDTRITIVGEDGNVRTVVHVDADGRAHVDAIAPNTRHGDNPEVKHPAPNAHYRVEVGHRQDAFVANADGTRQVAQDSVKIGDRVVPIDRAVIIEPIPEPANGRQVIDRDHPLAPRPGEAFTARTDLPPNTRMEVHDTDGTYRGTVQTDADGKPRWVAAPDYLSTDARNPEVMHTSQGTNYNIDRGPLHQEFTTDAQGHPQTAVERTEPTTTRQTPFTDLGQGEPFSRPGQVHDPSTEYLVSDEHGQHRGRFLTDESGHVVFEDTHSGQRSRVNTEITQAPAHAQVTSDGFYGLGKALNPAQSWPTPANGEVQLAVQRTKTDDGYAYSVKVVSGDTSGWTPEQRAAVTRPFNNADPFAARADLPPNTRFVLDDHKKQGYGTFQTGGDGTASHVHTFRPFSPDLNNPLPNAVLVADNDAWRGRTNGDGETVATTGRPDLRSGGAIRRDGSAQLEVGSHGEVDGDGKKLSDGGHHQGNETGGPGEAANQSSQQRDENQGNARPAFVTAETWHRMERDRASFMKSGGTVEVIDTFALRDPLQRHPHTYQTRWRVTLADGTTGIYVRSYPNEHNAALWPADF
ncbi:glycohydrolase toxin TNT-related protein [Saccharothrix sp. HUAS TT1]|uniref:WXG100-like domain-containing protein n=1 Tax=unclassified Saccharothrix TaxID=2593673 RepID=UPI00345C3647